MKQRVAPLVPASFRDVSIDDPFWSPRIETNRAVTIPFAIAKCEETGRIDNFAKAGRLMEGEFRGIYYDDSDVYKVVEGIAYSLAQFPDAALDAYLDGLIVKIAAAQEPDGYLYTNRTINPAAVQPAAGPERWSRLKDSHELYNVGHLYEAAVAHFEATGKRTLLDVALKNAELILATFGPGRRRDVPGHQEIEIGLVKLARVTGERRYLELAKFFLDERGNAAGHTLYGEYAQDHLPIVSQPQAVGHAVRALYMYCGLADVAGQTGERRYFDALERLWTNIVSQKMALTGGTGARHDGEAFGAPYELPNARSYNETCAAIAHVFFNQRMFLATGEAKYLDVLERTLYNGLIAGVSRLGDRFFYVNPLASDGVTPFNYGKELGRAPWFKCSCCPVNLARFLPSLGGYVYATDGRDGIFVSLFIASATTLDLATAGRVTIAQRGGYPWEGHVQIDVTPATPGEFAIHVRVPGWSTGRPVPSDLYRYEDATASAPEFRVNGEAIRPAIVDGFAIIRRGWAGGDVIDVQLPMPVRRVVAHPAVAENAGRCAIERGPLVYAVEGIDVDRPLSEVRVPADVAALAVRSRDDAAMGRIHEIVSDPPSFRAIPYYAWAHRGVGEMAVWLTSDARDPAPGPSLLLRRRRAS